MSDRVRRFDKRFFAVSFISKEAKDRRRNSLNSQEIMLNPIKKSNQNILICIRLRFSFIMSKIYTVPMQNLSTSPKKTDLNSEKKRLENRLQVQPKAATLQKILQFASSYRAEQINESQYVEWYLN
ncbi:MAG: hypothetical protein PHT07_02910 [Paludibacter sp.]|nr:hypothetical protein [Paludibacter sp.]